MHLPLLPFCEVLVARAERFPQWCSFNEAPDALWVAAAALVPGFSRATLREGEALYIPRRQPAGAMDISLQLFHDS